MAFNGTGTFVRIYNWVSDKINLVPITASRMDDEMNGMAAGLSNCITKDGQTTITANIPMNSHKFTGLSTGNARTDSLTLGQVQDGQFTALGLTGGAADAYTASPSPAITAYVPTMEYSAKIHATNLTTNPTLLISAISGGTIKKLDASKAEIAVEASDMLAGGFYNFKRNVANDAWILLNPEKSFINLANANGYAVAATESAAGIAKLLKQITIANNATDANNDIDFSAGNFQFSDGSGIASLSAMTKRLDANWSAGTNQGGLFSGAKAAGTIYYCFAIYNPTTGVADCGYDTSVIAANRPAGFTKYKNCGNIFTDSSGNIRGFYQLGNRFLFDIPFLVRSGQVIASRVSAGLGAPPNTIAIFQAFFTSNASSGNLDGVTFTNLDKTDIVATTFNSHLGGNIGYANSGQFQIKTNSFSQIGVRGVFGVAATSQLLIHSEGFIDPSI